MKKALKFLPLLALVLVLGVFFALRTATPAEATTPLPQFKVYLNSNTTKNAAGGTVGTVTYDIVGGKSGYTGTTSLLRDAVAQYPSDGQGHGNILIGGVETEVWIYVDGEVKRNSANTNSNSTLLAYRMLSSDSQMVTVHITSVDPSNKGKLIVNYTSTSSTFPNFMSQWLYFKDVNVEARNYETSKAYYPRNFMLCDSNDNDVKCTIDTGCSFTSSSTYGASEAEPAYVDPYLWVGSTTNKEYTGNVELTVKSGTWNTISFAGGYRGYRTGSVDFTLGGSATVANLAGWHLATATGSGNSTGPFNTSPVGSKTYTGSPVTVTLEGGTVTNYYGMFGSGSTAAYTDAVFVGNITTTVTGSVSISNYRGGSYYGRIDGTVTNNIKGGSFTGTAYVYYLHSSNTSPATATVINTFSDSCENPTTCYSAYIGGQQSGSLTTNVTGGAVKNLRAVAGGGTVSGAVNFNISGGTGATVYGADISSGGTVSGKVTISVSGTPNLTALVGVNGLGSLSGDIQTTIGGRAVIGTYAGVRCNNFAGNISTTVNGSPKITTYTGGSSTATISSELRTYVYGGQITNTFNMTIDGEYGYIGTCTCGPLGGSTSNGKITNYFNGGAFGTIRGGGGYFSAATPNTGICTAGVVNYFRGTASTLTFTNFCSGGGMGQMSGSNTVVYTDPTATAARDFSGTYTGTVLNFVEGGAFTGYYGKSGGTEYIGFNATESLDLTGDVITIVTGGTFGDYRGSRNSSATYHGDMILKAANATFYYNEEETSDYKGGTIQPSLQGANSVLDGNIVTELVDCSFYAVYGGGLGKVEGNVSTTVKGCTCTYIYGGGVSNAKAEITGNITNRVTDTTVSTMYGGGQCQTIGSAEHPSTLTNIINNSTFTNFYGGSNRATSASTLYGDIVNDITNITITTGNFCGGNFYGTVTGDVTTTVKGTASSFGSAVYAAGLRLNDTTIGGSVGGDVLITFKAGTFLNNSLMRAKSWAGTTSTFDCDGLCGANSYKIVFDLTENDIVGVRFRNQDDPLGVDADAQVEIIAGAGTLYLKGYSPDTMPITSITGTPDIVVTDDFIKTIVLFTLPDGMDDSDVNVTREAGTTGILTYAPASNGYLSSVLAPKGSTIILEPGGNFAMRYLYDPEEIAVIEAAIGSPITFTYSIDGGVNYATVTQFTSKTYFEGTDDEVTYTTFVVGGIKAANLANAILVECDYAEDDSYAISDACEAVIASSKQSAEFKAFAKATLDYNKAATSYFGGTAAEDNYFTDVDDGEYTDPYPTDAHTTTGSGAVRIEGTSLVIRDHLFLKFYVTIPGTLDVSTLKAKVGDAVVALGTDFEVNGSYYTFTYAVPASQMATLAYVTIVDSGDNVISNTYADSVASYCAFVTNNSDYYEAEHVNFCRYIKEYVFNAVAYFNSL